MYSLSWLYLYGVGGLIYALGTVACVRAGSLDFKKPGERMLFIALTGFLFLFAGAHALFQFVLPFTG